jgi:hypothetical protein
MDLGESGWQGVDLIRLVQDRDRWRAFVNMVMNICVLAPQCYLCNYDDIHYAVVFSLLLHSPL